jgi:hypothetical protein
VISQTPVGGTPVATGSAVNLVVSTGPALVAVPDVVTQTQPFSSFRGALTTRNWIHIKPKNEEERAAIEAYASATAAYVDRWMKNLKGGVPGARLVDLPGAGHFVFLTREAEVLQELRTLVAGL